MNQQQVGNAIEAPESENMQTDINSIDGDDFFESLDRSVNSGILDAEDTLQSTSNDNSGNTQSSPSEVEVSEGNDVLQKRYSDSSREAKRVNRQVKE